MEWTDSGTVIGARLHGETSAIIEVFTAEHGRQAGMVRGGASRKMAAMLQPGSEVQVVWRARLDEHLGSFSVEPLRSRAALLEDRSGLAGLNAVCAMLRMALPERDPHPGLFRATSALLAAMEAGRPAAAGDVPDWAGHYLRWELALLEDAGFALDLGRCAVTGSREDLAYVSPRTGRAVSRAGAGEWADRLLPLPQALLGQGPVSALDLQQGLALTGHFLTRAFAPLRPSLALPDARNRLVALLDRGT